MVLENSIGTIRSAPEYIVIPYSERNENFSITVQINGSIRALTDWTFGRLHIFAYQRSNSVEYYIGSGVERYDGESEYVEFECIIPYYLAHAVVLDEGTHIIKFRIDVCADNLGIAYDQYFYVVYQGDPIYNPL